MSHTELSGAGGRGWGRNEVTAKPLVISGEHPICGATFASSHNAEAVLPGHGQAIPGNAPTFTGVAHKPWAMPRLTFALNGARKKVSTVFFIIKNDTMIGCWQKRLLGSENKTSWRRGVIGMISTRVATITNQRGISTICPRWRERRNKMMSEINKGFTT